MLRHPEVHGGSGFAVSTVGDLGFEPTLGSTSTDAKPRRARNNTIEVGEGLYAAGVSVGGGSVDGVCWWGFQPRPRSAPDARREKGYLEAPC